MNRNKSRREIAKQKIKTRLILFSIIYGQRDFDRSEAGSDISSAVQLNCMTRSSNNKMKKKNQNESSYA